MAREQPIIASLGPKTSYTSQVARKVFAETEFQHSFKDTIESVFESIQSGSADRGVVPIENSSNGPVLETLDQLADYQGRFVDVSVSGEASLEIDHCLLGFPGRRDSLSPPLTPPGNENAPSLPTKWTHAATCYDHIKIVYSHAQAFGQCRTFCQKYLPHAELHEVSSTAAAALAAIRDPSGSSAALASAVTIKDPRFPLSILAEKVQDATDNETRFLVLKRVAPVRFRGPQTAWADELFQHCGGKHRNMLVSFVCKSPCAQQLTQSLNVFNEAGLKARLLAMRPCHGRAWQNQYYVELSHDGSNNDHPSAPLSISNLENFETTVQLWKFHGAWGVSESW